MNYHQPRQINPESDAPDAGKWRYTCVNDGRVWAEGYCVDCPGHDDKAGAYAHQTRYVLENRVSLTGLNTNQQNKCDVPGCEEWTQHTAQVGNTQIYCLCEKHLNIETVTELFGSVGDSYGSW